MSRILVSLIVALLALVGEARPEFSRQRIFPGFDGKTCKVIPSVASDGKGTALLAYQHLLLSGSDVWMGRYMAKSTDGGRTWSAPRELTALKDTYADGLREVRTGTVHYNAKNGRWFGLGHRQLYKNDREIFQQHLEDRPWGQPLSYSVDPEKGDVTGFRELPFPFPYDGVWIYGEIETCENGDILVAAYYCPPRSAKKYRVVIVRYRFNGDALEIVQAGKPLARDDLKRGLCEPSLVRFGGKYYLTIRSDEMGLFAVSDDGLNFSEPQPWTWDGKTPIGNRNTQQHWVAFENRLYLAYTREDAANGHVFRNRAPLYLAEFDPARRCLRKETEFPLVPELGARLGNFCVAPVGDERWLVTAEWMQPRGCEKYGSDNSIWLVRMKENKHE